MKIRTALFICMPALLCCAMVRPVFAADREQGAAALTEAKQDVGQAFKTIESYSAARKDEAIIKTQAVLTALDARIDSLESRSAAAWRSMSRATREKEQAALRLLRRERIKVAEWYGSMKNSSAEAWEATKRAFLKSTDALSDAFNTAEQQLEEKKEEK